MPRAPKSINPWFPVDAKHHRVYLTLNAAKIVFTHLEFIKEGYPKRQMIKVHSTELPWSLTVAELKMHVKFSGPILMQAQRHPGFR